MPRSRRVVASVANTHTARWLDAALKSTNLHETLKQAISYKLPRSAAAGLVEDHLQDNYLLWMEQDALAKHIDIEAREVTIPSNVRWWAVKNSYKSIRAAGREPVLRELLGAKTETDLKREKDAVAGKVTVNIKPKGAAAVLRSSDDAAFAVRVADSQEIGVGSSVVTMELDAQDLLTDLREKLNAIGHLQTDQHVAIVVAIADGASVAEAAMTAGVTTDDAKRMMVEVREAMTNK